jgi:polyisoprenoid-binding protein YceI
MRKRALAWSAILSIAVANFAAAHSVGYTVDPDHTYQSFASDHMGL